MFSIIIFNNSNSSSCYNSILRQTYKDYEIISSKKKNRAEAFNKSIDDATGDYILFLEDSDILENRALEIIDSISDNKDIVIFDIFNHNTKEDVEILHVNPYYTSPQDLAKELIKEKYIGNVCNKAFKLDTLRKKNIRFESFPKHLEDNLFCIKVFCEDISYKWIDHALCHSIYTTQNITTQNSSGFLQYTECIKNIMKSLNYNDDKFILQKKLECLNYRAFRTRDFNKQLYTPTSVIFNSNLSIKEKLELSIICFLNSLHVL